MREVSSDSRGVDNIVETKLIDEAAVLEKKRQGLNKSDVENILAIGPN